MSRALGPTIHLAMAAVLGAGTVAAWFLADVLGVDPADACLGIALPPFVAALSACLAGAWISRRRPFDRGTAPHVAARLAFAALAGAAIGLYAAKLSEWIFEVPLLLAQVVLVPIAACACVGRGVVGVPLAVVALHAGAQLGGQYGWGLRLADLPSEHQRVTDENLALLPWSLGIALTWLVVLRIAHAVGFEREPPVADAFPPPRRARPRRLRDRVAASFARAAEVRNARRSA